MKKKLAFVCSLALAVAVGIGGTLAYLTSTTDTVTNTFTVGDVKITLDEAKVKLDGSVDGTDRVKENDYKLLPGHEYTKDPTIHVDEDSEDCWVFVKVVDEIAAIEDTTTVAAQMAAKGWTAVAGAENVYAYSSIVKGGDDVVVFEKFKIKGDVTNLSEYADKTITVTAYAIQADGFDTAAAAWAAAPANFT